jgi:hypothetical protein
MTQSTSVLFSLQELARMEEERVRGLAEAEERERATRIRATREAEERARREALERENAEMEARAEVARRAREEAARLEAIRLAALEGARIEAEAKLAREAREQEVRAALARERNPASAPDRGTGRMFLAVAFGATVAAGVAVAAYLGVAVPRDQARAATLGAELASRDVTVSELRRQADELRARVQSLDEELAVERAEEGRLRSEIAGLHRAPGGHAPAARFTAPARDDSRKLDGFTACPPGSQDPLCLH